MKHNRRGFLRMLLAAPVAAAVGLGLYKPPLPKYVKYIGKMNITGDAMKAMGLDPKGSYPEDTVWSKASQGRDAFEIHITNYHQMFSVPRARITEIEV